MKISIKELEDLTHRAIKKYGYRDEEVQIIADVMLYAQMRDNNQGVVKLIGSGLALIGEILAGPLVGAAFCGIGDSKGNWGHLIFAIDPDLLTDRETLASHVSEIIRKVKSTKKLPGVDEIFVSGERESRLARQRRESGLIEVEDNLLAQLRKVAGVI